MHRLIGHGEVTVEQTGRVLGVFPYTLALHPSRSDQKEPASLAVDFGPATMCASRVNARLRLRVEDGRSIPFEVRSIEQDTLQVEVTAAGPLRSEGQAPVSGHWSAAVAAIRAR